MRVIDFKRIGNFELLTLDTGHVATLATYDGNEHISIVTRTGKPVTEHTSTWRKIEQAIFNTNPTRSK